MPRGTLQEGRWCVIFGSMGLQRRLKAVTTSDYRAKHAFMAPYVQNEFNIQRAVYSASISILAVIADTPLLARLWQQIRQHLEA
jgi:hypothetical protein